MVRLLILCTLLFPAIAMAQSASVVRPTLLDFSLPTCQPCRAMDPVVARLEREGFDVRRVDGSRQPQVAARYGVKVYPTFVLVAGDRELWRTTGIVDERVLRTSLINATPRQAAAGVMPTAFDSPQATKNAAFQVGGDLGPANPPLMSSPTSFARGATRPKAVGSVSGRPTPEQLIAASVRLRVEDPQGHAFGTGTIIDARQGEALVLTCGHLFREQSPGTSISIELFELAGGTPRVVDRAQGQVIAFDLENDVALVSLRPNRPVTPARVAGSLGAVTARAPVWSVGCDLGADPTVRTSQVNGVNRTHRPPNVTSTGAPIQGRSGGGLFNAAGELVGVCFGADEKLDEGLYADLVSIHAQLDKLGLTEIYRSAAPQPATLAASGMTPVELPIEPPVVRAQNAPSGRVGVDPPRPADFDLASLPLKERAALEELSRRAQESEVICIVRPKSAGGQSEVISLESVSPEFLQALRAMRGPSR